MDQMYAMITMTNQAMVIGILQQPEIEDVFIFFATIVIQNNKPIKAHKEFMLDGKIEKS